MGKGKAARRIGAVVVAGSALWGGTALLVAPSAGATDDGVRHLCSFHTGQQDDSPIADVIHHNVEPLLGPGGEGVHTFNCSYVTGTERVLLGLLGG